MAKAVVAITGASGAQYAVRLVRALLDANWEIDLIVTNAGAINLKLECSITPEELANIEGVTLHDNKNLAARPASGSAKFDAYIICPTSGTTIGKIAAGISDKCLIQLAYAIGVSKPLSIYVKLSDLDSEKNEDVKNIIEKNFDLSPRGIRELLGLNKPIYEVTSAYGHFGRKSNDKGQFTWEKTDKIDIFKK